MRTFFGIFISTVLALHLFADNIPFDQCPLQFEVVFVGRVTRIVPVGGLSVVKREAERIPGKSTQRARVWFAIERRYRGLDERRRVIAVETVAGVGEAGYDFKIGERYVVYADASYQMKSLDYSTLIVNAHNPSKLASEAGEEIRYLDELQAKFTELRFMPVLGGKAISKPQPVYPPAAKKARASGPVYIRLIIDETGRAVDAEAICGHPLLVEAALKAARQARFSPTLVSGKPVKISTLVIYNFVLQ